jgi:hypothetical protein
VWAVTQCISHTQADAQRQVASGTAREPSNPRILNMEAQVETPPEVQCPPEIEIQGIAYPVEMLGPNRGQVRAPAMNGCPAEDVFVFQCQAHSADDRDGQWIQVEAHMAPNCNAAPSEDSGQYMY